MPWTFELAIHRALGWAREAKHRGAVFLKHASWGFPYQRGPLLEPFFAAKQARTRRRIPVDTYAGEWFMAPAAADTERATEIGVPRRIFCLWTGDNEMPSRRRASLEALRLNNPNIDVVLVTPQTVSDWTLPEHPLHAAYENLSFVHRSDYLRAYLLHHHGGGYADIKPFPNGVADAFDAFEASGAWLGGYTEVHRLLAPLVGGQLEKDLRSVSRQLLGYGFLLARAGTPLSTLWLKRVHEVLDEKAPMLAQHPGGIWGEDASYPLSWTELLAHIVAPLSWRFQDYVQHDPRVRPRLRKYR